MKEISIVSGKGGTGKTLVSSSISRILSPTIVADCDVDASNLHLILKVEVEKTIPYTGGKMPVVDKELCTECNICGEHCRFGAIENGVVDPWSCDHCGLCSLVCPESAIKMVPEKDGDIFIGKTELGPMVYGELLPGAENSGKMVSEIRRLAKDLARENNMDTMVVDGPPGIGCPVISTLTGSGGAIVVTEPTPSGLHDIERIVELINHFRIPFITVINKWDLSKEISFNIEKRVKGMGSLDVLKIPFSEEVVRCMKMGLDPISGKVEGVMEPLMDLGKKVKELLVSTATT